jgi:hypothetical protein
MKKNSHHNQLFDAEEKDKLKQERRRRGIKTIRLTQFNNGIKSLKKSSSTRIVGWFNSKFKRISPKTLTRAIIVQ